MQNRDKKRILILGGGFAGVECTLKLESYFKNNSNIEIILVSEDNFLLFTPMLPQVASGTIETRHIVTPIRTLIKKTKFYEAKIKNIDPHGNIVTLFGTTENRGMRIHYDFLIVALGSQTNFFGLKDVEERSYKMATINDAILLRNRIIDLLEQAENGHNSVPERWKLQGKFLKVELLASLGQLERANQLSEYLSNVLNSNGLDEPSEFKIANTLLSSSQGNVASALKQIQAEFRRFRFDVTMDRLNYLEELTNAKEQERKALFDSRDKARQLEQTNQLLVFCIVSISLMAIFLVKMIVSKRKAYEKLEIANKTDLLTGMLNRRFLQMKLEQTFSMLSKSRRSEEAVLLFIDIDMFKSINDNFGHTVGDKVISMVSGQVMDCIRERDYAGRYGGEEFAVILNNLNAAQAMDIAERIRVKVRELEDCTLLGQRKVSVSIGVSAFDDRFKSLNEWLNDADQALYEAKRSGRDQVVRSNFNEPSQIAVSYTHLTLPTNREV